MKRHLPAFIRNFIKHDCLYLSSHISFCALLSIIPLILITVSLAGSFLGSSNEISQQLVDAITEILPQGREVVKANLDEIVGGSRSFGLLGVVILLFIATLLFTALERALDIVFEATKSRNFLHSRLVAVLLMGMISLCFFLPTVADLLTRSLAAYGFLFPLGNILRGKLFFTLFAFLAFVLVVLIIPNHQIRLRYAALGGLFFSFCVLIAKLVFRWYYLKAFAQYNLIYGSLTVFVLLLLWIFYVSNILLVAAELVATLQIKSRSSRHA